MLRFIDLSRSDVSRTVKQDFSAASKFRGFGPASFCMIFCRFYASGFPHVLEKLEKSWETAIFLNVLKKSLNSITATDGSVPQ